MATFLNDTFTDTDGTLLSAHTGELGATWTIHPTQTTTIQVVSNRVRSSSTSATVAWYYASGTPATADYDVEVVVYVASSTAEFSLGGRLDTVAGTQYEMQAQGTSSVYRLRRVINGTSTTIGSAANTFVPGTSVTMKLEMRGDQISAYADGVRIIGPITDTNITAVGKAGLRFYGSFSDTTSFHVDSIIGDDLSVSQYARPTTDVTAGAWTNQAGGTALAAAIGETVASDTDYIQSANATATADVSEVALGSLPDPLSSTGHIVRYRYGKDIDSGDVVNLTVSLRQGTGTQIAAWTHTNIVLGPTTVAQTLTAAQADLITNYSDIRLRFSATKV